MIFLLFKVRVKIFVKKVFSTSFKAHFSKNVCVRVWTCAMVWTTFVWRAWTVFSITQNSSSVAPVGSLDSKLLKSRKLVAYQS